MDDIGKKNDLQQGVKERMEKLEKAFGTVPLIFTSISDEPEFFLPYCDMIEKIMLQPRHLSPKMLELTAISAGAAVGGEHCLDVHLRLAKEHGATDGELFEAIIVGSVMSMTNIQGRALRRLSNMKEERSKQGGSTAL
jgi:AhpD family alkylhydroperoxidase